MKFLPAFLLSLSAIAATAAPVIDGFLDGSYYGAELSVQDTPTGFGDATNGHPRMALGGSEVDAAYAKVEDGVLYLFIAGNVEMAGQGVDFAPGNPNRLNFFIDSIPGGQNSLRGDNADVDGGGLNRMGHLNPENDGLKFDTNVTADFYFTFNGFTVVQNFPVIGNRELWRGQLHYATLPTGGNGTGGNIGTAADSFPGSYPASFTFTNGIILGFRNDNKLGVTGTGDPSPSAAGAASVTNGLELAIPLALLDDDNGNVQSEIRIVAFISNADHGFLSNQVLGPMNQPTNAYGNLGDPRLFDFGAAYSPGDQFFALGNAFPNTRSILDHALQSDGSVSNRWLAEYGRPYVVQSTDDLVSGTWSDVSGVVTATAATVSSVVTTTADRAFIRILGNP